MMGSDKLAVPGLDGPIISREYASSAGTTHSLSGAHQVYIPNLLQHRLWVRYITNNIGIWGHPTMVQAADQSIHKHSEDNVIKGFSIGIYYNEHTTESCAHISCVHAALYGLGILSPSSNLCIRVSGSVPGNGALPPLKISHIVTPYDH